MDIRKIDFFKDFIKNVDEAFNTHVEVEWEKIDSILKGKFFVNDTEYKIISEIIIHDFMSFKFKAFINNEFTMNLTNRGSDKLQVIPTIRKSLEFILDDVSPNGVVFGATDESNGRKMIYDRFCTNWIENNKGWDFKSFQKENMKIYILHKTSINNNLILDVIDWIKNNRLNY